MNNRRFARLFTCAFAIVAIIVDILFAVSAQEPNAEITTANAREILPPSYFRSLEYEIEDDAERTDFFYRFYVTSDYGSLSVNSIPMLRLRLAEINAIAMIEPRLQKLGFAGDLATRGKRGVGGDSVAEILTDPLGTAGALIGNIRFNLEETFSTPVRADVAPTSKVRSETEIDPDPHKRSAAALLNVDVYSSNKVLQGVLERVARAHSAGKLPQLLSVPDPSQVGPIPFGTGNLDARIRSKLKNFSAAEINEEVDSRLMNVGIASATRIALRVHAHFTPRSRLYLSAYLATFKNASNLDHVLQAALSATTEADALAFVNLTRMVAFYRLAGNAVERVVLRRNFPVFVGNETTLLALPVDRFGWSLENREMLEALLKLAASEQAPNVTIALAGSASKDAREGLAERGIRLVQSYSF